MLFAGYSILVCIVSLFIRRIGKTIPKAPPTGSIFLKFRIWNFYYNLPKIPILIVSDKETCKLHEELTCTYDLSLWVTFIMYVVCVLCEIWGEAEKTVEYRASSTIDF